jgi:hypothetical protein
MQIFFYKCMITSHSSGCGLVSYQSDMICLLPQPTHTLSFQVAFVYPIDWTLCSGHLKVGNVFTHLLTHSDPA